MEWQPIETAPKDGRHILIWDDYSDVTVVSAYWLAQAHDDEDVSQWVYSDELLADAAPDGPRPTYWMPLPSPPA